MRKYIRNISLLLAIITLAVNASLLSAQVYKQVDEEGNVTYSDAPQKKGDQPISLPEPTTIKITPAPKSSTSEGSNKPKQSKTVKYDSVEIVTPANDEAIRSNSGDITIQISSSPALHKNHLYAVLVDGSKVQETAAASVTLTNLDRGSHTILIQVQDEQEQTLASSSPITFHLLRASAR
ncbi:DUF4124 domain-containing protein [Kaarinaea lacus]